LIVKKIGKAKTDSTLGFDFATLEYRPEISNLVNIYSALSSLDVDKVCEEMNKRDMKHFKKELTDLIISVISPIREEMNDLLRDHSHLYEILKKGTEKAAEIANHNIKEIKDIIGFVQ
jgi:tryptophanyl-tRNA synthetase